MASKGAGTAVATTADTFARERAFAQAVASGASLIDAYWSVYRPGKPKEPRKVDYTAAERLAARLLPLIAELKAEALIAGRKVLAEAGVDRQWVMTKLVEVAERCMQARPVLDKRGDPLMVETPAGELAPAFTFDSKGATAALGLVGKELGMFVDRKEVRHGPLAAVPDAELDERIAAKAKEIAANQGLTVADVLRQLAAHADDADVFEVAAIAEAVVRADHDPPTPQGGGQNAGTGPIH